MLNFDLIREIFSTMRKNKLRTILTGFAVAWGIFMLVVLLACGNGLKNGFTSNFADRAQNSVTVWPGWTSKPYNGMPADRRIRFDFKDYDLIRNKVPHVEYVSARITQNVTMTYGQEYGAWNLNGVSEDALIINNIKVSTGRFLNAMDSDNRRKVVVISEEMQRVLFKEENPIGKFVVANNIAYRVIGIYDKRNQFDNNPPAYIPFTTAQMLYNKGSGFRELSFTVNGLNTVEANQEFIELLRGMIAELHHFDPEDRAALQIRNMAEQVEQTNDTFNTISVFVLIVGVCSLMAGSVGVGNIMLITVKERTREIGIRKALGASPASVLKLIIVESIFITTLFGYIGMVMGIGLSELMNIVVEMISEEGKPSVFKDPTVDVFTVLWAMLFLVLIGVVAGLIPALKAVKVKPIEAMRAE